MEPSSAGIPRTTWLALLAMGISVVVIANDFSAINVALPTMERVPSAAPPRPRPG